MRHIIGQEIVWNTCVLLQQRTTSLPHDKGCETDSVPADNRPYPAATNANLLHKSDSAYQELCINKMNGGISGWYLR